ncbi:MAG TPA: hypothetical protein VGR13_04855 [Actinomycetota bacterium]|jgi:hypothetical protein|nr:hypothetical protein [Actinomycetota bacterium]
MFTRKKREADEHELLLEVAEALPPAPDEVPLVERTTCYPQDGDPPPRVAGVPRTTVYRQAVRWNRGGYDATN